MITINKILVNGQSMNTNEEIYSTEETVIGKWIDGKSLYRITNLIKSPTSKSNWFQILKPIADLDRLVNIKGTIYNANNTIFSIPVSNRSSGNILCDLAYFKQTVSGLSGLCVYISNEADGSLFNNVDMVCTLEYTKTTDE